MSNAKKSKDAKALIKAAKLPERAVDICLAGDLVAEIQTLEAELAKQVEADRNNARMVKSESKQTAEKIEALRERMTEHTITVVMRALTRKLWRELMDEHPPKKGDASDEAMGVDLDPFLDAVVPLSIVDPELDDDEFTALSEALSSAEWEKLTMTAWTLNRQGVDVPKSPLASLTIQRSVADSK